MTVARLVVVAALMALAASPAPAMGAGEVSTAELQADPTRYDGARLTVRGVFSLVYEQEDLDPQGRHVPVHVFTLNDGRGVVLVVAAGKPVCAPGSVVTVEGVFIRRGKARVQADNVRC